MKLNTSSILIITLLSALVLTETTSIRSGRKTFGALFAKMGRFNKFIRVAREFKQCNAGCAARYQGMLKKPLKWVCLRKCKATARKVFPSVGLRAPGRRMKQAGRKTFISKMLRANA